MRFYLLVIVAIAYLAYVSSESCVQCNSNDDPKCATNPDSFMAKQCVNLTSKCYTRIQDGKTLRGCASDLDNATASRCNNELECLICSFMEGCNRLPFPIHRAQCLQCEGSFNSSCANDTFVKPVICPLYKLGDKCFIRNTGKNVTTSFQRGCLYEAQLSKRCTNETNCYTCEGPGCNFLPATSDLIPVGRDSAAYFSFSITLLVACIFAVHSS